MKRSFFESRADTRAKSGRVIPFRASNATRDRHGTIIKPEGINTERFQRNPVFLWGHDGYGSMFGGGPRIDSVIGKVVNIKQTKDAFDIDVEFATKEINPQADMAFKLVEAGFLNAVSIGFLPHKQSVQAIDVGDGKTENVPVYEAIELMEVSLVPIPSNPDALTLMRSMWSAARPMRTPEQEVVELARNMFGESVNDVQLGVSAAVLRIGKVLSSKTENHLRQAKDHLDQCLAQIDKEDPADTPPEGASVDAGVVTSAVADAMRRPLRTRQVLAAIKSGLGV